MPFDSQNCKRNLVASAKNFFVIPNVLSMSTAQKTNFFLKLDIVIVLDSNCCERKKKKKKKHKTKKKKNKIKIKVEKKTATAIRHKVIVTFLSKLSLRIYWQRQKLLDYGVSFT